MSRLDKIIKKLNDRKLIEKAIWGEILGHTCDMEYLITELSYYKDLQNQGRLFVLPCKIGDKIYSIERDCNTDCPNFCEGSSVFRHDSGCVFEEGDDEYDNCNRFDIREAEMSILFWAMSYEEFNKTLFLTREEAEAALKGDNKK